MWFVEHTVPQPPQFEAFVFVFVSQPLATLPSQFAFGAVHAIWHEPPTQLGAPFADEHTFVHDPQCEISALRSISQPSDARPLQSAKPATHDAIVQEPLVHAAVAC